MATKPQAKRVENSNIKEVEKAPEENPLKHEAKKRFESLKQQRETAVNSLQQAVALAKQSEQQSLILRGRISVFEEEMAALQKQWGFQEQVQ
jgi:hypothetical protein